MDAASLDSIDMRVKALDRQIKSLRRELRALDELVDTINSPLYKRIWWWLQGYHFRKLGRWYGN